MPRWNNEHPVYWQPTEQLWKCRDFNCGFYATNEELEGALKRELGERDKDHILWVHADGLGNFLP